MNLKPFLCAFALTLTAAGSLSAATLTFQFTESGSDVVLTTSGAVSDSAAWNPQGPLSVSFAVVSPTSGSAFVANGLLVLHLPTVPPPPPFNFGTAGDGAGTYDFGPSVGFGSLGYLGLPVGYNWGDPLVSQGTFSGQSFASLGMVEGNYSWVLGNDTFEVKIGGGGGSAVPETGATLAGLALAMAGLVSLRQRVGRRAGAQA